MELKFLPGDLRSALKVLIGHPIMQIRLSAAQANLAIDYSAARREIQAIIDSKWHPQAWNSGIALENIGSDSYKPT